MPLPADPARLDAALAAFSFRRVEPQSPLPSPAQVRAAARAAGVTLPEDYVDLCARHGTVAFDVPAYLPLPAGGALGPRLRADMVFAIGARADHDPLQLLADTYADRLPPGLLPIGTDPGGNLLLLGVGTAGGEASGAVHAWDHEHRELTPGEFDRRIDRLRAEGVPVDDYDIDQLMLLWDERPPARVGDPSAYGNLYPAAPGFIELLEALQR